MHTLLRYTTFPLFFLGVNGAFILLIQHDAPLGMLFALLAGVMLAVFAVERLIPYNPDWNRPRGDAGRDLAHLAVNSTLHHAGLWLLPWLASLSPWSGLWPAHWPFWLQVVGAALALDCGITLAHWASHRYAWLWRFHAVHHSVQRMYGLNGLMKHPVHQLIETASGTTPLLLLGIPGEVALALVFCVAVQLLLQHANADYRTGPLKYVFAHAEGHRLHHRQGAGAGDVNFGLFTLLWDHLLGSFAPPQAARLDSAQIGLADRPDYPRGYLAQLAQPLRRG